MTQTGEPSGPRRSHRVRNIFITGLFFLVPMAITYMVLEFLVRTTYRLAGPYVGRLLSLFLGEVPPPLLLVYFCSFLLVLGVVFLIGWLGGFYLGKKLLDLVELAILRLPFVRTIYGGTKQIIEAFSLQQSGSSFKKVVMAEYPRRGCWVLGFVTNENMPEMAKFMRGDLVGVFIPPTPNPTTGFLLYYDPFDLYLLDLEIEEAVKLIVSAGLVMPPTHAKKQAITLGESLGLDPDKVRNLETPSEAS